MIEIGAQSVIEALVNQAYPKPERDTGLYIRLDISIDHPDVHKETGDRRAMHARRYAHFVIMAESNYKHVFYAESAFANYGSIKNLPWEDLSHHDSCWTTDGLRKLTTLYFEMCEKVGHGMAPMHMQQQVSVDKVQKHRVEKEVAPEEAQTYGRTRYVPVMKEALS